jgi:hypothetical protein
MMKKRLYGVWLALVLSLVFLAVFFGKVIRNPNNTYFSVSGDGFKAYYAALYHVQHDTVNFRTAGMNYPFGELLPFTDSQPPVVNSIRFISRNIVDISHYTVAILNLLMLLSIVMGALFLCLIFMETGVTWWYAALVSVGVAILSPQIGRLGGHFSLAWIFWIPLMGWLVIRFDKSRLFVNSVLMGVITCLAGLMHFYYLGFFGFLTGGYWFWRFIYYRRASTFWYRDLLHFSVQYIIPVLLLQFIVLTRDTVTDRPAFPFGYQSSMAHPAAVFFPSGTPWTFIPKILTVFKHISWESNAFIGTVALLGFITGLVIIIKKILRKEVSYNISSLKTVNVMFWASVVALFLSFGIPLIPVLKEIPDHFGIIRQLRVLARFSWLFYYFINIVVFAAIFHFAFVRKPELKWKIVSVLAILLLWIEGSFNLNGIAVHLNNRIPELEDRVNQTQVNSWIQKINVSDYQAIIPMPYFHIGSENIWIDGSEESKRNVLLASLKTGLPTTGVILSRTSISETYMNDALFREPLQRLELADFLSDERPFLICQMNGYVPDEAEIWLLKGSHEILQNDRFTLSSLPVNYIKSLHETWRRHIVERFESSIQFPVNGYFVSDSLAFFKQYSLDQIPSSTPMRGTGAFSYSSGEWRILCSDTLKGIQAAKKLIIGFWVDEYLKDGTMRSNLEIVHKAPEGTEIRKNITEFFRHIKAYQGDWALVEMETETQFAGEILQLSVRNNVIPHIKLTIDELLIRKKGTDIWKPGEKYLIYNGRSFLKR